MLVRADEDQVSLVYRARVRVAYPQVVYWHARALGGNGDRSPAARVGEVEERVLRAEAVEDLAPVLQADARQPGPGPRRRDHAIGVPRRLRALVGGDDW